MTNNRTIYMYEYWTNAGKVLIVPQAGGGYQVRYEGEVLGTYVTPEGAVDDVVGGHTFTPSNGIDLGSIGIPDDLGEWKKKPFIHFMRPRRS